MAGRSVALRVKPKYGRAMGPCLSMVDLLTENQISGNLASVKTTLDLPDDLMRAVKIRAVHEHKKLKDAIAEFIRKGMAAGKTRPAKRPKPVKLRGGPITTEEIEAAIAWGRD